MLQFLFGMIFGVNISVLIFKATTAKERITTTPAQKNIATLKNALLSFALSKIRRADIDDFNFCYEMFDGTKLPPLSGADHVAACFNYILDEEDQKKHPFYTKHMSYKYDAIDKYLESHFATEDTIIEFMRKFISDVHAPTIYDDSDQSM